MSIIFFLFFFNSPATTEIYTLSLHDALPIFANGDSITFEVRRCFQCSAGKSKNARSASASFSSVVTAFGYFGPYSVRSEEHTSELQSQFHLVCRLLLEKKKTKK